VLKERSLIAIERLMGELLVRLSVQRFLDGMARYFQHQKMKRWITLCFRYRRNYNHAYRPIPQNNFLEREG
jgi:hypothetical protein